MCVVPSWIETKNAVLFLTDKDAMDHGIAWQDATGHTAIRNVYKGSKGKEREGIGDHTPQVVIDAIMAGKLNNIAAAGHAVFAKWMNVPWGKVGGCLDLSSITSLPENATFPDAVGGSVDLSSLVSMPKNVAFPKTVGGFLDLGSLPSLPENVTFPETVGGCLDLSSLTSLPKNVTLPKECGSIILGSPDEKCKAKTPKHIRRSRPR